MEETIFDKIIRREIPADIVYEDDDTIAFLDARPVNPGHTLVVPKRYARNLLDADAEVLAVVMKTVQKVAHALMEGLSAEGVNIVVNNERAADQLVFRLHIHVIPRFPNDGVEHWHSKERPQGEAAGIAEKLRAELGS